MQTPLKSSPNIRFGNIVSAFQHSRIYPLNAQFFTIYKYINQFYLIAFFFRSIRYFSERN